MSVADIAQFSAMKPCRECGVIKPLDGFSQAKRATDGYRSVCKACVSEYAENWDKHTPELFRERENRRRMANKERVKEYNRNARARRCNATGRHTAANIAQLLVLQKSKCPVCRISLKFGYHVDHVIPLANGGSNGKENIQLLCPKCNQLKHAKDPIQFMQERGFLI